jgi:hypothetical protein
MAEPTLEWTNPERTRRLTVERQPSGTFRYCEEHFFTVDETAEGEGI